MKKHIYKLIALVLVLQSCTEFLEEENPNFSSTDTYWSTLDESESNLASVYAAMLDEHVIGTDYEFVRSDVAFPGRRNNIAARYREWYTHALRGDNNVIGRFWDSKYRVIWRANQLIEGLNRMPDNLKQNDRWTQQMGQARFFRGLMHFYLHSTYNNGSIIIRDGIPTNTQEYAKSLSTSEEVRTFFRSDLEYAYENLVPDMDPVTRADAASAATILGTSYLYEKNYPKAMEYFDDVITNSEYGLQLEQDIDKMFTNAGAFNSESILELNYSTLLTISPVNDFFNEQTLYHRLGRYTGPAGRHAIVRMPFQGQSLILPSAWLTYEYSNEVMDTQDPRNFKDGDINGTMRNVPLRGSQSIAVVNDETSIYYGYTAPQVTGFGGTRFSNFKKYTNHDIVNVESETGGTGWRSGRNLVLNRLSGVYLMQAECLTQTGDITGALALINDVRKRWGLQLLGPSTDPSRDFDEVTYNETTLMDHLMYKEFPLELGLEGFSTRFLNLRRWGVTAERFQQLSTEMYGTARYTYTRPNGSTANRNGSLIQKGTGGGLFSEYGEAASAWQSSAAELEYYPIPLSESLYNPNVNP